jgi:hypothetical protein
MAKHSSKHSSKHSRRNSSRRNSSRRVSGTRKLRGGVMLETLEAARTALLPFLLYKAQRQYMPKKSATRRSRR